MPIGEGSSSGEVTPLIALVLYWNMLEYVRRDLKKIIKARAAGA